jgi:preprotein translocase subunit SecG
MYYVFGLLSIIAAALLVLLVVIQNSKGGGLSGAFGSNNLSSMIGNRRATQDIEKFTWYMAAILLVVAFVANVTASGVGTVTDQPKFGNMLQAPPAQQAAPEAAAPAEGAPATTPPAQ